MMRAVTIRDVAAEAGVSVATASRALSGQRRVAPELVARVQQAAATLGYRSNAIARALRSQRTGIVGMVVPEISNPFFPDMVEAVERQLQQTGRDLVLCDSQGDPDLEAHRVRALVGRQVDGLIISPCDATRSAALIRETREVVPLVQLDRHVHGEFADWVGVDDEAGISAILSHLASVGAATFSYVGSEPTNSSARLRLDAYKDCVLRLHRPSARRLYLGEFTTDWGYAAARQITARQDAVPHAIVCGNDVIAFGVMRRLREASLKVPQDVMVTGFDDTSFAELYDPPLTTVQQPRERMAAESIRLLDQRTRLELTGNFQRIAIAPELVIRGTTRPLAVEAGDPA